MAAQRRACDRRLWRPLRHAFAADHLMEDVQIWEIINAESKQARSM